MTPKQAMRGLDLVVREDLVDAALWRQYLESPAASVRQKIFDRYMNFTLRIARNQFHKRPPENFDLGDVEQLALEALLQAIDRYDPLRGVPFQGFLRPRIQGNIANGLSKASEANAHYRYRYRVERERLSSLLKDTGTNTGALAKLSKIAATLAIGLMLEDQGDLEKMPSSEPSVYETLAWEELNQMLRERMETLPEKEAFVIQQHYKSGVSFQQIAALMGLSKGRISQLHASALSRLRMQLSKFR